LREALFLGTGHLFVYKSDRVRQSTGARQAVQSGNT